MRSLRNAKLTMKGFGSEYLLLDIEISLIKIDSVCNHFQRTLK